MEFYSARPGKSTLRLVLTDPTSPGAAGSRRRPAVPGSEHPGAGPLALSSVRSVVGRPRAPRKDPPPTLLAGAPRLDADPATGRASPRRGPATPRAPPARPSSDAHGVPASTACWPPSSRCSTLNSRVAPCLTALRQRAVQI